MEENRDYCKLAQIFFQLDNHHDDCLEKITAILDSGFDVNTAVPVDQIQDYNMKPQWLGYTVLHYAVSEVNFITSTYNNILEAVIKLLLSRGADFTRKNHKGLTPLCLFFYKFQFHDCDTRTYDKSQKTFYEVVFNLLLSAHYEHNNTANPCCNDEISHFHLTCFIGNVEIAKFFLAAGVPVDKAINKDSKVWPGYTALHIAMMNKDKDMVHLLLEHGASYNHLNADGVSPLHLLSSKEFDSRIDESFESESLKNMYILNLISKLDKDKFKPIDSIGLTLLHQLCIKKRDTNDLDDLKECLNEGVNVNATVNFVSPLWPGYTPLHFAAHCSLQIVTLLLKAGANLMVKDADDVTPLDLCIRKFKPDDVCSILKTQVGLESIQFQNGANLIETIRSFSEIHESIDRFEVNAALPLDSPLWPGFTLLHLAVLMSGKNMSFVRLCLERGADFTIQDANKMTALHLAFRLRKHKCVRTILDAHVDNSTNPVDDKSVSHFHVACAANHIESVEHFLLAGVNPDMPLQAECRKLVESYIGRINKKCIEIGLTPLQNTVFPQLSKLQAVLLEHNADPHAPDVDGFTWIHREFMYNAMECFRSNPILWSHHGTLKSNPVAPGGLSVFHLACYCGNPAAVGALLPLTKNVNEPITMELLEYRKELPDSICLGDTPLHLAVKGRNDAVVGMLVEMGADEEAKNGNGLTPLHETLRLYERQRCEWYRTMRHLSEAVLKRKNPDEFGLTRLHVACALKFKSLIRELLKSGDEVDSKVNSDSPVWPGFTPFQVYVCFHYSGDKDNVKSLLSYTLKKMESLVPVDQDLHELTKRPKKSMSEVNESIFDESGQLAFFYSCMYSTPAVLEKFIKLGFDVNRPSSCFSSLHAGYTPLHFATEHNVAVIKLLLKHGASINTEDVAGHTPLHLAALKDVTKLKMFLRSCKVDLTMKNSFGLTVIDCCLKNHHASYNDYVHILKHDSFAKAKNIDLKIEMNLVKVFAKRFYGHKFASLIEYAPNFINVDADGRNVIHHIAQLRKDETFSRCSGMNIRDRQLVGNIESILKKGCELDHQDKNGKTPLHLAVENNDCVEELLLVGADVNILDNDGKTAYMYYTAGTDAFRATRHICKMRDAGLYLRPMNVERSHTHYTIDEADIRKMDLNEMKGVKVSEKITLRDVLTEEIVLKFPVMPLLQRQQILKCVELKELCNNFAEWLPLFKMQVRRALKRQRMFETIPSLQGLFNQRLPEHCLESILIHLTNDDWNNVIKAYDDS